MDGTGPIPPLLSSLAAAPLVQERQSAERTRRARHEHSRAKVSSAEQEHLERQVESPEAVEGTGNPADRDRGGRRNTPHRDRHPDADAADGETHLDITA